jgi:uncharacterized membrane protein YccC
VSSAATSLARQAVEWRPHDPGRGSLRRSLRVALVMPLALAFAMLVLRDTQATTFAAFGSFALIVLADFGGRRAPRAAAYAVAVAVGALLVVLGTLVSPTPWLAALAMFVVAFCVQFLGVFGSYTAAAQPALQLLFVLTVSIPAPASAIPSRLLGWIFAGVISTLASILLWPRFERVDLDKRASTAFVALADLLQAQRRGPDDSASPTARDAAGEAVRVLHRDYSATAKRPAGPARRDRAFVEMVSELERILDLMNGPLGRQLSAPHPVPADGNRLVVEVVRAFVASAQVLKGGAPPDLRALEEARTADRTAIDGWAAEELRAGRPPESLLAGLDADHALRAISYLALAAGTNATLAAGGEPEPDLRLPAGTPRQGASRVLFRIGRTLRAHLSLRSSVLHNAFRSGLGLGLAVLVARVLELNHAFWVVLGAASVLRTNALATGRTMVQALLGTLLGFAVGAGFTALVGKNTVLLWIVFPIVAFLAGYASTAVSFLVGQAAFTVNVLILFNLISPVGWRLGLARIEDVAIGAGISVMVGVLLWPRGARQEFSRSLGSFYRAVGAFLDASFDRVVEGGPAQESARARQPAVLARDRASDALEQFMNERAEKRVPAETGGLLLASASHALMVGDALNRFADLGYSGGGCQQGARVVHEHAVATVGALKAFGERMDHSDGPMQPVAVHADGTLRRAAVGCLDLWREDANSGRSAIAIVAAVQWLEELGGLAARLEVPVANLVSSARVPWWR